jgi:iron complex outermembrane receptor protein
LVFNLDNASFNQSVVVNLVDEDTAIIGDEAFMNPVDSSETSVGYYVSKDFADLQFDFGMRINSIERSGSITGHDDHDHDGDDHDGDDHDGDDHDGDDHDGADHDGDHAEETKQYSYNSDMTSFAGSVSRNFGDAFTVSAGGARVNRAPSSSELFMNGPHLATGRFEVGDPDLASETHNNFDVSFDYAADGYFASVTFFMSSVEDYIYLVDETEAEHADHDDDHGGLIMAEFKQSDADFNGYELEVGKTFDLASGSLTLTYARDTIIGELGDGSDVPRMVPARNIYSIAYNASTVSAALRLKDVEKQTRIAAGGTPTDGYQMLDFSMTKAFRMDDAPTLNVSIFGKNLLNEVARNHTSFVKNEVPLPGRNYGLKFNFEI